MREQAGGRKPLRQPRIWGGVPLRNPDFVGRDDMLDRLRRRLAEQGGVLPEALYGLGGVGKSQLAAEYVHRYAHEYDIVWWVSAEHLTTIQSSFVDLAKRLGISASNVETAVPAVLETLRSGVPDRGWILVFDNAEDPELMRQFLPAGVGHVVLTSRNAEWAGVARAVEVDLFTREESKELLHRRACGRITDRDADRLADALGDLPLAVEQAGSWYAQTGMSVASYVDLLEKNSAELLKAGAPNEHELPVAAAWNVSLDRLKADRRGALELLRVCAFFGPEPISRGLLTGVSGPLVPDVFADAIKLNSAIREISRYSLAKIDHGSDTIQLHRLVQTVLRDQLDRSQWEYMRHAVHLMLVNGDPGDPEDSANWPAYAALLPHVISSRAFDCTDGEVGLLVANLERYLANTGVPHEGAGNQLICAVDIAGYGSPGRTFPNYTSLRAGMYRSVKGAFEKAGIPWRDCFSESTGDGILILAPATIPKGAFAGTLLTALTDALREHNETHPARERIKLRLVLHAGEITRDEHGPIGPAIIRARRLLDAPQLKDALASSPGPLAVIVSDWFYTEVVWQDREYAPEAYRKVVVDVKETSAVGWIRLPDHDLPPATWWAALVGRVWRRVR